MGGGFPCITSAAFRFCFHAVASSSWPGRGMFLASFSLSMSACALRSRAMRLLICFLSMPFSRSFLRVLSGTITVISVMDNTPLMDV